MGKVLVVNVIVWKDFRKSDQKEENHLRGAAWRAVEIFAAVPQPLIKDVFAGRVQSPVIACHEACHDHLQGGSAPLKAVQDQSCSIPSASMLSHQR